MLKKIMFGIIVLLMLVLTTSAAFAGGDVLLDNMTSHLKADILVINEDVDNAISLQRWDLTADGSGLSTLTSITEATLCLYIYNVDVPGTLDDDVEVCQVNPIFVSEVSYNNFAFCSDYDNGANLTLSSTTENTTTCINITSVLEDWDGSSDFGLRFFDPDNHEQESDINVFAYDDAGLAIGLSNGTGSYDFEDRELSRGSGNVTTLNISYNYKPVLSSVVVTPATPDSADDLTCTPTATDNESDTITYTYA